jgi:hypothetical protein
MKPKIPKTFHCKKEDITLSTKKKEEEKLVTSLKLVGLGQGNHRKATLFPFFFPLSLSLSLVFCATPQPTKKRAPHCKLEEWI